MDAAASHALNAQDIAAWLAKGPFAAAAAGGAALVVGADEPPRARFATPAALATFGAKDLAGLDAALFGADSPGARRLRQLMRLLPVGGAPRLESLRFFVGRLPIPVGWLCARLAGPNGAPILIAAAPMRLVEDAPRAMPEPKAPLTPAAASTDAPFTLPPLDGPVRFLWTLDREDRFGPPDPALVARLGSHAPREGETPRALCARVDFDRADAWGGAIDARQTFSSLRLEWPEPRARDGLARARVALISGAPVFDRERNFVGFRGFGIFTGQGEMLAMLPAATECAADSRPEDDEIASLSTAAPTSTPALEGETIGAMTSTESEVVGATSAEDFAAPVDSIEPLPPANASGPEADAPTPVHGDSEDEDLVAPDKVGRERGAEIYVLRFSGAAPASGLNVVPIRPGALSVLTSPPPEPEPPRGEDDNVELTSQERDAFREIARALGVRPRGSRSDADGDEPIAERDAGAETVDEPVPPAEAGAGGRALGDLAGLLDHLPIGALVTRSGEAIYLNRTLLDLVGFQSLEQFRGEDGLNQIFRGRDPESLVGEGEDMPLVAAGGEIMNVDAHARAISWEGEPAILIAIRRSREVEHQARLRAVEREARMHANTARDLAAALDLATDGMIRVDAAGRILAMNGRAEALFGYDQNEAAGESVLMLLAPSSQAEAAAVLDRLVREDVWVPEADGLELVARDRDGRALPVRLDFGRVADIGGREYFMLIRDLSHSKAVECEREAAREAAETASARKTEFLARVSHEIRTPLHAILGFAEVMMEERFGPIGNERYKDYIKDIHASGQHVMSLTNDLLDLSKIESGKMELQFGPVDANKIIRECVALMQPQAARERIIMRLSLFDKLPNVMADERSLRQIMLNLMSNAVKFNEPGGQVIISTALDEAGHSVIRVRDTGIGMNESELSVALEPFRRVPGGQREDGTGLGLPLTKALAEANHADFSIKSRREHGTLVEVAFPSARAAQ